MPVVQIALDPLLTPQQNAAKYYKRYNKAKTAERRCFGNRLKKEKWNWILKVFWKQLWEAEGEQDFRHPC